MNLALLFSGQGSQYVGMGKDLYDNYDVFRDTVDIANDILKRDLRSIIFSGPDEKLTDTRNAQPALLTVDYGIYKILKDNIDSNSIKYTAGHSLGEYGALVASGILNFEDALKIVQKRGNLMSKAGEEVPGTMAAIIGMRNLEKLEKICIENDVSMANYNSPLQVVISGKVENIHSAMEHCKKEGAKKVIKLNVSGAFHSKLMDKSGEELAKTINETEFNKPEIPIVMNVKGEEVNDPEEIKENLIKQVTSPVKWVQSMEYIIKNGIDDLIECGPKKVLTGLMRRINRKKKVYTTDNIKGVKKVLEVLS